ncbi:MAG: hypothetical protein JEZ11_00960 [Desulfobacterales bacterium]|nr:hypothetical protein [Desulfobacterales bacterium]
MPRPTRPSWPPRKSFAGFDGLRNPDRTGHLNRLLAGPAIRSLKTLLEARATENQAYVVGVNRVDTDGNGLDFSGDSSVFDPLGTVLFRQGDDPVVHTRVLSKGLMDNWRKEFPAWQDADRDLLGLPD